MATSAAVAQTETTLTSYAHNHPTMQKEQEGGFAANIGPPVTAQRTASAAAAARSATRPQDFDVSKLSTVAPRVGDKRSLARVYYDGAPFVIQYNSHMLFGIGWFNSDTNRTVYTKNPDDVPISITSFTIPVSVTDARANPQSEAGAMYRMVTQYETWIAQQGIREGWVKNKGKTVTTLADLMEHYTGSSLYGDIEAPEKWVDNKGEERVSEITLSTKVYAAGGERAQPGDGVSLSVKVRDRTDCREVGIDGAPLLNAWENVRSQKKGTFRIQANPITLVGGKLRGTLKLTDVFLDKWLGGGDTCPTDVNMDAMNWE